MLSRSTVQDIVECRLPEEKLVEHLETLTTDKLDVEMIRTFIDVLGETLDEPSRELRHYIGANDPSGTGGSGIPHFNASTTVAFILAAGEMKVAKFGNRGAQSRCGSFDLLDTLGIPSHTPPQAIPDLLEETGVTFLYAPQYYPGLAKLAAVRKKVGKRTVFNIIGPLLNPIRPDYRVMGIACSSAQKIVGEYLAGERSNRRSLIVRSDSGLDELEPYAANFVVDAMQGYVGEARLNGLPLDRKNDGAPSTNGLGRGDAMHRPDKRVDPETARTQIQKTFTFTQEENHKLFMDTVRGEGPQWITDLVCLNAAAGFVANCCSSIEASFDLAYRLIKSGAVADKVEQCRRAYAKLTPR